MSKVNKPEYDLETQLRVCETSLGRRVWRYGRGHNGHRMSSHYAWICALFMLPSLICPTSALAQRRAAYPIAFVSMQRILAEAEDVKAATKELEQLRAGRSKELNALKQAVDATRIRLANAGGIFSRSERADLTETLKRQEIDLQQATQKFQTEIAERQKQLTERFRTEIGAIVSGLAKTRGVVYVLDQGSVLLGPSPANWTDEVLEKLNAAPGDRKP